VTRVSAALAGLPQALCYFNPGGELVWEPRDFVERFVRAEAEQGIPIHLWCNVRVCGLDDFGVPGWRLMDTVGMAQLDAADHEAIFPRAVYDSTEVAAFLLNTALYVFKSGPIIASGDTMGGPGDVRWQAMRLENGRLEPLRHVIRWLPLDGHPLPPTVTAFLKPHPGR
jgi:hypothetical protein